MAAGCSHKALGLSRLVRTQLLLGCTILVVLGVRRGSEGEENTATFPERRQFPHGLFRLGTGDNNTRLYSIYA